MRRDIGHGIWQRHQQQIEFALVEQIDQLLGQVFADKQLKFGMIPTQRRQRGGQQERRNRRYDAQADRSIERFERSGGFLDEGLYFNQYLARTTDDHGSDRSQQHAFMTAFNERDAQCSFQLLDASAERGLGDMTGLGGIAEMLLVGDGAEVLQLAKRGFLSHRIYRSIMSKKLTLPIVG
jgi:hypothetical protein